MGRRGNPLQIPGKPMGIATSHGCLAMTSESVSLRNPETGKEAILIRFLCFKKSKGELLCRMYMT